MSYEASNEPRNEANDEAAEAAANEANRAASPAELAAIVSALREYEGRLHEVCIEASRSLPGMIDAGAPSAVSGRYWLRRLLMPERPAADVFLGLGDRLSVAEPALLRRALALRALYARRAAVRRCIDRQRLNAMRLAVGVETLDRLRASAAEDGDTGLPLPELLDLAIDKDVPVEGTTRDEAVDHATPGPVQTALVREGLWRLRQERTLAAPALIKLIMMQLGADATTDRTSNQTTKHADDVAGYGVANTAPHDEAARFLMRLPQLIPEFAARIP